MNHKPFFSYLSISDHHDMKSKEIIEKRVKPKYLMSDDDSFYFNEDESTTACGANTPLANMIRPSYRKSRLVVSKIRYIIW